MQPFYSCTTLNQQTSSRLSWHKVLRKSAYKKITTNYIKIADFLLKFLKSQSPKKVHQLQSATRYSCIFELGYRVIARIHATA
jgi:hypothetical protein